MIMRSDQWNDQLVTRYCHSHMPAQAKACPYIWPHALNKASLQSAKKRFAPFEVTYTDISRRETDQCLLTGSGVYNKRTQKVSLTLEAWLLSFRLFFIQNLIPPTDGQVSIYLIKK